MTAADILILAVLALSVLFGLWRGFVSAVLALAVWLGAFWAAWAFGHALAGWYRQWLTEPTAALVAGYVSCFLAVIVAGALLGMALRRLMNHGGLRGGDRVLGALFGFARGIVVVTFAVLMLGFTQAPQQAWWRQSVLLPPFVAAAGWVGQSLPPQVTHYLQLGGEALPALRSIPISALPGAARRAPGHGLRRADVGQ